MTAAALSVETVTENSSDSLLQSSVLLPEPASLTLRLFLTNMSLQSAPVGPLSHIWESPDWCVRQCQLLSAENTQTRQFLVQERCQISLVEQQTVICAKTLWSCEETAKWHCFISAAALRGTGGTHYYHTSDAVLSDEARSDWDSFTGPAQTYDDTTHMFTWHVHELTVTSGGGGGVTDQRSVSVNETRRQDFSSHVRGDRSIKGWCF